MDEIIEAPIRQRFTILVVEEDDGARPSLTKNLRRFGYCLLVAASVEDALEWVSGGVYIHADLLLLDLIGISPERALAIGQRLRVAAQYHVQTPLVVMPERVAVELEGTNENVGANDWICYYEDADQLQRLIGALLLQPG